MHEIEKVVGHYNEIAPSYYGNLSSVVSIFSHRQKHLTLQTGYNPIPITFEGLASRLSY